MSLITLEQKASTKANLGTYLAVAFLSLVILFALFPGLFTHSDALETSTEVRQSPSLNHLFGTDASGRDVFSRVIHGTGTSLLIALITVVIALVVALLVGMLVSVFKGSSVIAVKTSDLLLAIPEILLALIVLAILGKGTIQVGVAVAIAVLPAYIRISLIRSKEIMKSGFYTVAVQMGVPRWKIAITHVFPNLLPRLLIMAVMGIGSALVIASSLSFLGLGVQPPSPEWGAILSEGRTELSRAWWISFFPGLMVVLTVVSLASIRSLLKRVFA